MADILKNLEPKLVFTYFEELCAIPHGSGNVQAISDYCVNFAKSRNLEVIQDEACNVIIKKAGSSGYEDASPVILQGHLDMVCEKESDVSFDFEQEGLHLFVDGDWIHAGGTTLGGDDGIAVAMALAILDDPLLVHPPLEVIFTTNEETGMDGAKALDTSGLHASYMINIDSETEGILTVGCAGGLRGTAVFERKTMEYEGTLFELKVCGLLGGHSGSEIHLQRANANKVMGRILYELHKEIDFGLISIDGGAKDNAIARECTARVVVDFGQEQAAGELVNRCLTDIRAEYRASDPDLNICMTQEGVYDGETMSYVLSEKIIYLLFNTPYGVVRMSDDLPGLVETSLNLGIVTTESSLIRLTWSIRSSVKSQKLLVNDQLIYMTEMLGGTYRTAGDYPGWAYRPDSVLTRIASDVFHNIYGKDPVISTIHAGLECGLFSEKMPDLDIISIGPDILDIHTPKERLSIASTARTYTYVCALLEALAKAS